MLSHFNNSITMAMKWHKKLEQLRLQRGEKQEHVADAIGISQSTYCAWETGKVSPKLTQFEAVLAHYGVTLEEFALWQPSTPGSA